MQKNQLGSALLVALFIVMLVTIIAGAMIQRLHSEIRVDEHIFSQKQLYAVAEGASFWAIQQLKAAAQNPTQIIDTLPQSFDQKMPSGYFIHASLSDAQGKLNLNNLSNPAYLPIFSRLLINVIPQISADQAQQMAKKVMNQLTQRSFPNQNQLFIFWKVEELEGLPGFTNPIVEQLKPYLTALPESTPINVNSASDKVLLSLSDQLTATDVERIVLNRQQKKNYRSLNDWITMQKLEQAKLPSDLLTVTSQYFQLNTTVTFNEALSLKQILHRVIKSRAVNVIMVQV